MIGARIFLLAVLWVAPLVVLGATPRAEAQSAPALKAGDEVDYYVDEKYQPANRVRATVVAAPAAGASLVKIRVHHDGSEGFYPITSVKLVTPAPPPPAPPPPSPPPPPPPPPAAPPAPPQTAPQPAPPAAPSPAPVAVETPPGGFKVGDLVEVDEYDRGKWLPARVIGVNAGEPRYLVQFLSSDVLRREGHSYEKFVRPARGKAVDEWEPAWIAGPWSLVQGPTQTTGRVAYEPDGSATVWTEQHLSSYGADLAINIDGTYLWVETGGETIRGRWVKSQDTAYVIVLLAGRRGEDWKVWPSGRTEKGVKKLRAQSTSLLSFYGFQDRPEK